MTNSTKHYIKELFNIALPIIMGNLGFILIGVGDVLIAGRHSTDTLAAISIATAITNCIQTFGVGLIAGVSPLLSNFRGENKSAKKYFYPTLRFAFVLAVIVMLIILAVVPLIGYMHFAPNLVPMIKQYMFITAFATFGGYLHIAVKEFLQAFEIVMFPNLLTVFAVVLNVILNVIFVFGLGIIPSMGVVGLAIASFTVRYFMGIALLIYCLSIMRFSNYVDRYFYKQMIKIGLPISTAIFIEFVAFNIVPIIMGRISGAYAAAQNILCTMTTVSFMVPFAISNAIAVKVGFANGAKNLFDMKKYIKVGVFICVGFMTFSAAVFCSFPEFLVSLFTKDVELVKICVPTVYVLSAFQIFDGLQVSLSGVFKGLKSTNVVLLANFVGYWLIAIPLGAFLAFDLSQELRGFWIGLFVSSVALCIIMLTTLLKRLRRMSDNI